MFLAPVVGTVLGVILFSSPVRGWLVNLLTGVFLEPRPPVGDHKVYVSEGIFTSKFFRHKTQPGFLRRDGEELVLRLALKQWRIARGDILELEPLKGSARFFLWLCGENDRVFAHPIRFGWQVPDDGKMVNHQVLLTSRSGRTFGHDRRLDVKLFEFLERWREGDRDADLSNLGVARGWPGPLAAALLVMVMIAAPFVHNHLIETKVRPGHWTPPAWPHDPDHMGPTFPFRVEAVSLPMPLTSDWLSFESSMSMPIPVTGLGDPTLDQFDLALFGFYHTVATPSHPGGVTHFLSKLWGEWMLDLARFPPTKANRQASQDPALRVISIQTGNMSDFTSFPGGEAVLFKGEKIFYSRRTDEAEHTPAPGDKTIRVEYGWIGVAEDERHPLGHVQLPATEDVERAVTVDGRPNFFPSFPRWEDDDDDRRDPDHIFRPNSAPVFFPGGRRVLYASRIIDLESGEATPIERPPEESRDDLYVGLSRLNAFGYRDRLRVRIRALSKETEVQQVWEIDPDRARMELFAELAPGERLMSTDSDRWLVSQIDPDDPAAKELSPEDLEEIGFRELPGWGGLEKMGKDGRYHSHRTIYIYKIHDPVTGRSRELFRESPKGNYMLVKGERRVLCWAGSDGWTEHVFESEY